MDFVALALAVLAAVLHVIIFVFESVLWTQEPIWRRFKLESQDQAELTRPLAFNQGFYNLFLAVGTFVGVVCVLTGASTVGWTLIIFGTASMTAAAAVLVSTGRRVRPPGGHSGALSAPLPHFQPAGPGHLSLIDVGRQDHRLVSGSRRRPDRYRYWDGTTWSATTTEDPRDPRTDRIRRASRDAGPASA